VSFANRISLQAGKLLTQLSGLLGMFRHGKRPGVGMGVPQRGGCTINLGRRIRRRPAASDGRDGMRNTEESKDGENSDHYVGEHGGLTYRIEPST